MAKYDAVDRLMALATEKRADRTPQPGEAPAPANTGGGVGETPHPESSVAGSRATAELIVPQSEARVNSGNRGRRLLKAIQPLLPAVAGAMRLVDHGAVQAAARLLPLLGGALAPPAGSSQSLAQEQHFKRELSDLQASLQVQRNELDALQLQVAGTEDELRRSRSQLERVAAELRGKSQELGSMSDRVRLLTATVIILLMLILAEMVLLVVMFHR